MNFRMAASYFFFFKNTLLIFYKGRNEEEKHQCESVTLIYCLLYAPLPGIEAATQAYALTGNGTSNPLVHRTTPSQLSHTSQGISFVVEKKHEWLFQGRGWREEGSLYKKKTKHIKFYLIIHMLKYLGR